MVAVRDYDPTPRPLKVGDIIGTIAERLMGVMFINSKGEEVFCIESRAIEAPEGDGAQITMDDGTVFDLFVHPAGR